MKIGIISDTHGCVERWRLAYDKFLSDADLIIHTGDILYHGPRNPVLSDYSPGKLAEELNSCLVPIVFAKGNCDSEVDAMVLDLPIESPYAFVMADGLRIVVTHGHLASEDEKLMQVKKWRADLYISGHTHVAGIVKRENTVFLNPGSPSMTKRPDSRSTVAVLDGRSLKIMDIDTGETVESFSI